jgi:hypothetical protein
MRVGSRSLRDAAERVAEQGAGLAKSTAAVRPARRASSVATKAATASSPIRSRARDYHAFGGRLARRGAPRDSASAGWADGACASVFFASGARRARPIACSIAETRARPALARPRPGPGSGRRSPPAGGDLRLSASGGTGSPSCGTRSCRGVRLEEPQRDRVRRAPRRPPRGGAIIGVVRGARRASHAGSGATTQDRQHQQDDHRP